MTKSIHQTVVEKRRAASLSIASNTFLVLGKLVIGIFTGSVAVISEAIHSAMDLLAALIAFAAVTLSSRPPDEDHPHGHGKIEDLSGAIEALLIFGAVVFIGHEAIHKLIYGSVAKHVYLGIIAMGVSSAVNIVVSWYLQRVGKRTDSSALLADAAHLRTDVYTSLGVLLGLVLVHFTKIQWLDPVAALVVGLFIVREAWQITRRSVGYLLDESLPEKERKQIEEIISEAGVTFHALRSRKSGPTRQIDLHLEVSPKTTAEQVHALCDRIEAAIEQALSNTQVMIHPEPQLQLDSTRPIKELVEGILNNHKKMFLGFSDLCIHESEKGIHVAVRIHVEPQATARAIYEISKHLQKHIEEHVSNVELHVSPCPPSALGQS